MTIAKVIIRGHSMWPTLCDGDELLIHFIDLKSMAVGDIVSFIDENSGELVSHRIINTQHLTKGDRSFYVDGKQGKILGLIVGVRAVNGRLIFWGEQGQILKGLLSWLSRKSLKGNVFRHLLLISIILISKLSFLFYLLSTKDYNKELQKYDLSQDA